MFIDRESWFLAVLIAMPLNHVLAPPRVVDTEGSLPFSGSISAAAIWLGLVLVIALAASAAPSVQEPRSKRRLVKAGALPNGQWNIPELRLLLEDVIPRSASVIDYEVRGDFPEIGHRTMLVSARRLVHPDSNSRTLLLSMVGATERRRREEENHVVIGELRHRIRTRWL